ncbi:MAG: glycosyltransferase [Candidatus Nealsonbacteria bacterium]|nr:glycosyltransferase [Candidatus Nealsonbacteria bacterium]
MKNILLVSHYTDTPGVMDKLSLYFLKHNYSLVFALNPLNPKSSLKSVIKIDEREIKYKIFWPFQYIFEGIIFFIKYKFNIKKAIKFDLTVCFDPLSFFHAFLLKRSLKVGKIVYYNVDFSTRRFRNRIANYIYLSLNKFAFRNCNYSFYLTENFIKNIDPNNKYRDKTFLLKHTININSIDKIIKKLPNSIAYAGNLSQTVDFTNLIKALELIKKEGINFTFDIYGEGYQKEHLEDLICKSIIKDNVNFKGIVSNEILLKEMLPKYMIGVCPYITRKNDYVADNMFTGTDLTTKIVEYIGSGLPVVATRLYGAFYVIEKNKFGFLVYSPEEWYMAIKKLLLDKNSYKIYSNNTLNFAKNYDEEKVLTSVFNKILQDS